MTYWFIKEEFDIKYSGMEDYMIIPVLVLFDIITIIFQPIYFILYRKKKLAQEESDKE